MRLREENSKLISDLDKALTRAREAEEQAEKKEKELRDQVKYYKDKCSNMVEEAAHKEALEECSRLKRELEYR